MDHAIQKHSLLCVQYPLQGGAAHPIALWSDELSVSDREYYHKMWRQPRQPIFQSSCVWPVTTASSASEENTTPLQNVHLGIPPRVMGKMSLVQGPYAYYHYGHQNIRDKVHLHIIDKTIYTGQMYNMEPHRRFLGLGLCIPVLANVGVLAPIESLH